VTEQTDKISRAPSPAALAVAAVRNLSPYVTGKPMSELSRELGLTDIVKLASNENPLGPSPLAMVAMQQALHDSWLYPDGNGHELKVAIAARHGVGINQITLGNGSNDLLVLLAEAFLTPQVNAVISQYAFAIYALVVQATGAAAKVVAAYPEDSAMPHGHDLDAMCAAVDADTRLVYIANPNNPTGSWCTEAAIRRFLDAVPRTTLVVLDEAYFEYARRFGCPDGVTLVAQYPNLIVLRTFSKAHALAGLRVGYGISHPDVADILNRVRQPFNVSLPALAGAEAALGDAGQAGRAVALVEQGMALLKEKLPPLGVKLYPSAGNFLLADVSVGGLSGQQVFDRLLRHGVIVRPVGGYGLPHCVRITIGTAEQNQRLVDALRQCLTQPGLI
jgi:histidinol-phosphate aminotransferase